jgi:hypothetical protein
MKAELLARTGWRGKLNDRVISPAFRTLEDLRYTPAHSDSRVYRRSLTPS